MKLLQERYSSMTGHDGKTQLQILALKFPKIRLLRSMAIENETMQVLLLSILINVLMYKLFVCVSVDMTFKEV